ncbi:tetratricopeptide repeat protein, partial [Okeania sp. SIO2B3]|uniref:tetratricopeptide repeat protein n=1 Tax=Okeania sp. SIO2B3 TaxID=2607784 RepID=UPI0025E05668
MALKLLGVCAYKKNQIEQAIVYYQKSLKINPNDAETHNNLAVALQDDWQIDAAFSHCQTAIKFCPNYAEAWHNLGRIFRDKGQFEAAIEHYQKSLKLKPNYVEAYNSLGSIFLELGKLAESQNYYQEAIKLDKNHVNARFGLAVVLLKQGNFIPGFSEYEWRCQRRDYVTGNFAQPVWDGSDFSGKTLLVYTEQGLGDSIQFIRYIPLVKKLGGRVIVGCNKAGLKLLFTAAPEIDELFVIGEELPDFDLQIPLMSLPRIFGTTRETIPAEIPYLFVPESKKFKLPETGNSFKIGITWETNSQIKTSKKLSCSVADFQSILNVDNASFYILQKDVSPQDLKWLNSQTKIHNLSSYFQDLADTAAVIKQLDLVITIDTVIAHLAGALGKPVWVMLNFDSDWRWLVDREDSPWYPTMRLFRQSKSDNWQGVCREVVDALSSKLLNFNQTDYPSIIKPGSSVTTQQLLTTALEKYQVENWKEAEKICLFIIQYQPHCASAFEILALCAKKTDKIDLEIDYHQKAINFNPNNYQTHLRLAIALKKQQKIDQAIVHNQRAIELKPNDASAWHNLGLIFKTQGNIPEAIRCFQQSLQIKQNNADIYYSWGNILKEQGNLTEAKVLYEKCIELKPNHINVHFARGFILLKQGDFLAGFSEYEWRCQPQDYITRSFAQPVWDGSDFSGKTLLVYTEQGLGDSIQFIRYIPLVKKLGGRVIFECNRPELKLLFTTVSEIDELFVEGEKLPDFDLQISLMSLPLIFQTTPETIPAEIPYLSVPKSIYFPIPPAPEKNLKVGICWQTNSTSETSKIRSCSVEYLQAIINIDRVNFYILQKEVSVSDLEWLNSQTKIHNNSTSFNDLADTAAAIKQLGLVITIDTVIAHLAGALGKPVWVILNFDSDWRWLIDREDSPWYPTARLFRQPKIGDWHTVFIQVKQPLIEFMESQKKLRKKFHLAYQYYQQKNFIEAEKICRIILAEKPQDFDVLHLLAVLENLAGRNEVAIQLLNQVINLHPNSSQAYSNLAKLMKKEGCLEEAIAHYQTAISLETNDSSNYSNLGNILKDEGRLEEAIAHYQKAISLEPNDSSNYSNLGNILKNEGRLEEAIAHYQKAISLEPNNSTNYSNLGLIFLEKGEIDSAIINYENSRKINPENSQTNLNLGVAWKKKGDLSKASTYYQQAINLQPDYAQAYNNLGSILQEEGNLNESIFYYQKAIELEPDFPAAHLNLSLVLLLLGDLKSGFQEYNWRWQVEKYVSLIQPEKLWDGSNLVGKTILIYAEQGYGDTIQFIRYLPLVKQQGGQIILVCQKPLVKLLEKIPGIDKCIEEKINLVDLDVHAPLLELPRIFGTTLDNIPPPIQNLNIPHTKLIKLEYPAGIFLKVGIVWATRVDSQTYAQRSCKLTDFQSILDITGITFYSLQKEPGEDIQLLETLPIFNLSSQLNDFADTAGIITQLDLVITVDTAVAHLAGTLGKPVWILLPFVPDWRWMLDRNDSPWYPTARLFRQPKIGDWHSVFIQVKQALIEFRESQHTLLNLPANFYLAYQYYQQNNFVEAEKICRLRLAEKPQDFEVLDLLAVLENLAGRNEVAIQLLNQVINLQPNFSEAYSNLAKLMKKEGRLEEAIAHYQKAIELEPSNSSNYLKLGLIFLEKGEMDVAIINYETSIKINPDSSWININLGFAWEKKGDLSKASTYYQQAIEINPNYAEAWCKLGNTLQKQGQVELAIEYYEQAITLESNYPDAHFGLAMTLLLSGNLKSGFQEYHWRWARWEAKKSLSLIQPEKLWDGSNLAGKI